MKKELSNALLGLVLGGTETQFVSECVNILRRHHCKRVAQNYARMEVHKASERLQKLLVPERNELVPA